MCLSMKQTARMDASLLTNPVGLIPHQTEGLWVSCTMDAMNTPSVVFFLLFFSPSLAQFCAVLCMATSLLLHLAVERVSKASAPQCYLSRRTESLDGGSNPLATPVLRWTVGHLRIFPRKPRVWWNVTLLRIVFILVLCQQLLIHISFKLISYIYLALCGKGDMHVTSHVWK